MYYLVQSNIRYDPDQYKIYDVLEEMQLPYETIEMNASINKIEIKSDRKDVFVLGSVKLARLAKANTE